MTTIKTLEQIENLEEHLQAIKWSLFTLPSYKKRGHKISSVVKSTMGLLEKRYPKGTIFENRIRSSWKKRFKNLEL